MRVLPPIERINLAAEQLDDIFLSRDFGDMVRVIDGRATIVDEVTKADARFRVFLKVEFAAIRASDYFDEALQTYVEPGREGVVAERISDIAKMNDRSG